MRSKKFKTLPWWMAGLTAGYLVFAAAAAATAERALAWLYMPGLLAMALGAQFLRPIGLATAGAFMPNPTSLGYIVLITIYSGAAYAFGWVIRVLATR